MNRHVEKDPLYLALKSAGADEKPTHEAVARQLFINSSLATKDDLQKLETVLSGKIDEVKDDVNQLKDDVHTIKVNEAKIVTRLDNLEKNQDRIFVEISDLRKDVSSVEKNISSLKDVVNDVKVGQAKIETTIEKQSKKQLIWLVSTIIGTSLLIVSILSAVFYLLSG